MILNRIKNKNAHTTATKESYIQEIPLNIKSNQSDDMNTSIIDNHKKRAKERFRKLTGLSQDEPITEEMLKDFDNIVANVALHEIASKEETKSWLLESDDITVDDLSSKGQQIAKDVNAVDDVITSSDTLSEIETVLNDLLRVNLRERRKASRMNSSNFAFNNVIFVGHAGSGKTAIITKWAKSHPEVNLMALNAQSLQPEELGLMTQDPKDGSVDKRATKRFNLLNRPNSILFIDEFDKVHPNIRGLLLTLINNHIILNPNKSDSDTSEELFLENMLFTIIAMNPPELYNGFELNPAEINRAEYHDITVDIPAFRSYLYKKLESAAKDSLKEAEEATSESEKKELIEEANEYFGRLGIAKRFLDDPTLVPFDDASEIEAAYSNSETSARTIFSSRSFELLLNRCNGTKEDFISKWSLFCNPAKLGDVKLLLANFKNTNDRANAAVLNSIDPRKKPEIDPDDSDKDGPNPDIIDKRTSPFSSKNPHADLLRQIQNAINN